MKRIVVAAVAATLLLADCTKPTVPHAATAAKFEAKPPAQTGRYQLIAGEYEITGRNSIEHMKVVLRIDTATGETDELVNTEGDDKKLHEFWSRIKE